MAVRGRASGGEYAERINAAADLVRTGRSVTEAAAVLVARFGISDRQARRYVERAAESGPVEAPGLTTVFTVKLPVELVTRVRAQAATSGRTISALVAQALEEYLARGRGDGPGR
ncbi:MAG: ribbon-helix-helix protein, CopG family [Candidatus Nanopelagicales bacterium]|nr:ribbon-helix-helix protein, CopG family [Candidatus Nanopelagicales bacterium]